MVITKSGPRTGRAPVKNKTKCWECGQYSPVFVVSPSSGNPLCQECGGKDFVGVEPVKKRAQASNP